MSDAKLYLFQSAVISALVTVWFIPSRIEKGMDACEVIAASVTVFALCMVVAYFLTDKK